MNVDPASIDASGIEAKTKGSELPHTVDFVEYYSNKCRGCLCPECLLQVLLVACLFGVALAATESKAKENVLNLTEQLLGIVFRMIGYIMKLAPIGALGQWPTL